ncbi:hypothetical protein F4806DRAFT_490232 [Annulohypoxylon nitens]|nr:hypothetical protein F4806DRAFT_490232 [Annulohypoxylon nitens]
MGRYSPKSWKTLVDRQEQALHDIDCVDALSVASFDELEKSLFSIVNEYGDSGFPDIVNRLEPGFRYLERFDRAITSASQYEPTACLVWGVMQAFVQSACQPNAMLDDMINLVTELNESLSEFEDDLRTPAESPALQAHLQDIYEAYMDYCIDCIRYMKSPSLSFITYILGSDPASSLRRTKEELKRHIRKFRRTAKLSTGHQRMFQNIGEELTSKPLEEPVNKPTDKTESKVTFPVNTVTMYKNFIFLGRDSELNDIRKALHPAPGVASTAQDASRQSKYGQGVACCILQGLGGIGKTQTALEYTFRYREEYDAIFWVRAELNSGIASAYANICSLLGLSGSSDIDEGEAVELAKKWLSTTKRRWLIVYDNVEGIDDVAIYCPSTIRSESNVIITTQRTDVFPFTEKFTTIQIKDLTRDEGADLLFACLQRSAVDEEEREYARMISDLLGGLPLALTTIGGYLHQTKDAIFNFFNYLKTSSNAWVASAVGPAKQYEKTLATVYDIALRELSSDARMLINILAFLNPDYITEDLFTNRIGNPAFALPFLTSAPKFSDTIGSLRNRQLVDRDTSGSLQFLRIHRTVQMAVLHDLSSRPDLRRQSCDMAFALVQEVLPKVSSIDNPEPGAWTEFRKYAPHILTIRAHCVWPEPPIELSLDFAQVLSDMSTYMWHAGLLADGIDALRTAEHILDVHDVGIDHHLRGNIEEHIGICASFRGVRFRDEAMSRRHKAILAREASHKKIETERPIKLEDEIRRWNVQSDMAFGLLQPKDFAQAGVIIEKCHDQYKEWGPPEKMPFEYLKYNHIISHTYMAEGRPLDAIRVCKEGARLGAICCGAGHPMTLNVRYSMANHLYLAGMVDESLEENLTIL